MIPFVCVSEVGVLDGMLHSTRMRYSIGVVFLGQYEIPSHCHNLDMTEPANYRGIVYTALMT